MSYSGSLAYWVELACYPLTAILVIGLLANLYDYCRKYW